MHMKQHGQDTMFVIEYSSGVDPVLDWSSTHHLMCVISSDAAVQPQTQRQPSMPRVRPSSYLWTNGPEGGGERKGAAKVWWPRQWGGKFGGRFPLPTTPVIQNFFEFFVFFELISFVFLLSVTKSAPSQSLSNIVLCIFLYFLKKYSKIQKIQKFCIISKNTKKAKNFCITVIQKIQKIQKKQKFFVFFWQSNNSKIQNFLK